MTPVRPGVGPPSLPADLHQQIIDAAPGPIVYVDAEHRCYFVTHSHGEWLGHARAQVEDRLLEEVFGEVGYATFARYVDAALAGKRVDFEWAIPLESHDSRELHVVYIPHRAPDGTVDGFLAM